jgi:hypothetical protein
MEFQPDKLATAKTLLRDTYRTDEEAAPWHQSDSG